MNPLPTEVDSRLLNSDTRGFRGYTSVVDGLQRALFCQWCACDYTTEQKHSSQELTSRVPTVHAFLYYIKYDATYNLTKLLHIYYSRV